MMLDLPGDLCQHWQVIGEFCEFCPTKTAQQPPIRSDNRTPAPHAVKVTDPPTATPSDNSEGEDDEPSSWAPVDLHAVLTGDWQPPQPVIGHRDDGAGLFYPGRVHSVVSETEGGKTWFALAATMQELGAGHPVLYLDFEDDPASITGRLRTLQVTDRAIGDGLRYVGPDVPLDPRHGRALTEGVGGCRLAIIDGITVAMELHGFNPLDNRDAAAFARRLTSPLAKRLGLAVVCLDHVTKDRDGRGRYALGAVHKLNGLNGAAYLLDNRKPFGIGLTGRSTIRIAKDRPGQLRHNGLPSAGGTYYGDLVLTSHADVFAEIAITAPTPHAAEAFRPTEHMARIAAAFTEHGELSQRQIEAVVPGRSETLRQALALLQVEGYVSNGRPPHRLIKPYLQAAGSTS